MPNVMLNLMKGLVLALADEYRRGDLGASLKAIRQSKRPMFANEFSHADLLEDRARDLGDKPMLYFRGRDYSYAEMDRNANRMANFLKSLGGERGKVIAILMKNSPRWLDVFFGAQKLGMCAVPTNIQLRGDGLAYIFNHSEADYIAIDLDLYHSYEAIRDKLEHPHKLIIDTTDQQSKDGIPGSAVLLERAYEQGISDQKPQVEINPEDYCMMLYTSGTTGRAKGVPTKYSRTMIKTMIIMARATLKKSDVYYTCLPLFHANALILTVTMAMGAKAKVALYEKFSARKFWDDIRESGTTVFNSIGAMIPILMKQPERPNDLDNKVKHVLSAACPLAMWEPFEKRFGIRIYEGYGSVDGGGFITLNAGNAPPGSMGKPLFGRYRLVDDEGRDVPTGTPGELIFWAGREKERQVEYYKDEKATESKMKEGWLYTGDLVYADEKGNLYFAGRKTESLRRKGENISAYEVEQAILEHPEIVEAAVYAVPSDLAEDEVMAAIVPLEDKKPDPFEIIRFLQDKLAKFAIPRYWRIMKEMPKTETQRVIKGLLEKEGVTPDTIDTDTRAKN
jgi:crotonobetaine/carnitine-CoA ligase